MGLVVRTVLSRGVYISGVACVTRKYVILLDPTSPALGGSIENGEAEGEEEEEEDEEAKGGEKVEEVEDALCNPC